MANGDKAAARGWSTFPQTQSAKLGYDNDNYVLDRAAEIAADMDTVKAAVNQPIISVARGTQARTLKYGVFNVATAVWATPDFNTGFTSWNTGNTGELVIKQSGMYRVQAHLQVNAADSAVGVQVVRNTTDGDTANTLAKGEGPGRAADANRPVRLVAGDVLRVLLLQRATGSPDLPLSTNPFDLTFSVEWLRA
jgi:hypothetical protein